MPASTDSTITLRSSCFDRGVPDRVIRRQGEKWRLDRCVATDRVEELTQTDQQLIEDTKDNEWWNNRLQQFDTQPVLICDGKRVYRFDPGSPDPKVIRHGGRWHLVSLWDTRDFIVEYFAYTPFRSGPEIELSLRPAGTDDPEGTVVLELKAVPGAENLMYQGARYWLDPNQGICRCQARAS